MVIVEAEVRARVGIGFRADRVLIYPNIRTGYKNAVRV